MTYPLQHPRAGLAALAALTQLGLVGCGRPLLKPKPPTLPPALAPAATLGLNAGGEQPDWTLQVRPKNLAFTSPTVGAATLVNAGPAEEPLGVAWIATGKAGAFKAVITAQTCRDAATGLSYPFTARVDYGGVSYGGCAAWPGQGLGPRR